MLLIVENYLREHELICYGGTAINNILPLDKQFYDYSSEIPDYDCFSKNAVDDAKKLADIFIENGFSEVEAKSGIHTGTYKVYVNFIPIADITQLNSKIFNILKTEVIEVFGISYAPPDYLRMSMYLELSRPKGYVSRWEKIVKRLGLLNMAYPMKTDIDCYTKDFSNALKCKKCNYNENEDNRELTLKHLIGLGVVFFGGYASSLYDNSVEMTKKEKLHKIPYYDVISANAHKDSLLLKAKLRYDGLKNIIVKHHNKIGENVPEHYEITIGNKVVAFIYQAIACHNYNILRIDNNNVNIATIDTMLNMYLAFMYTDQKHMNNNRIVCMANYIFDLHQKHRLNQKGLFKRFNLPCVGEQETMLDIRRHKSDKYEELKNSKDKKEFEKYFLRYIPSEHKRSK